MTDEIEGGLQESTPEPTPDTDAPEVSWQQQNNISNPRFDSFKSVEDLAKSYTELETHQHHQVRFPSENAGEEDVQKFNQKMLDNGYYKAPTLDDPDSIREVQKLLGTPAEASGYELTEIEGAEINPESEGAFKAIAHEAGLTKSQATKIHEWLGTNIANEAKETAEASEKAMAELKGEWAQAFDHKIEGAKNAASMIEERVPGITEYFDSMAENGYDANMIRLMDAVGEMLSESGATKQSPRETLTKQEALAQFEEIRNNPNHPANDDSHPSHKQFADERVRIMKIAFG